MVGLDWEEFVKRREKDAIHRMMNWKEFWSSAFLPSNPPATRS